jgi:hypothetical protein
MATGRDSLGFFLATLGVLIVIISTIIQFYNINHGSSNQITIASEMSTNITCVMTGISLFIVGFILWIMFNETSNKYLAVFLVSFTSFILANMAILFSLYQVNVVQS